MSYQVLARKWRPANFSQVAGQSHVLKSLINALDNQRLHHAYLFTGTRGVGKTTLARILAKCLNCETGISSVPCGECSACREINEGRFMDLIEVDAASRTKVEDTRELLENVQYRPGKGRFKVYLIDEVHMLSKHSFNALLKTLEEPPEHVKFLFATTDPQKLPITILSRCLQFNLKNLSPERIVEYLRHVLNEESIEQDEEALWQIAAAAAGSMRDALTLADQAISYCQGSIGKSGVVEMLGVPDHLQVYSLLSAMAAGKINAMLELVSGLSDRSPDYAHTLDSLLTCLHRLAIAQVAPESIDNSFGDREQLQELAKLFSAEDIQLFYQIGVNGRTDLRAGIDIRSAFEMLLIRMMVFSPTLMDEKLKPALPGAENTPAAANSHVGDTENSAQTATTNPAGKSGHAGQSVMQGAKQQEGNSKKEPAAAGKIPGSDGEPASSPDSGNGNVTDSRMQSQVAAHNEPQESSALPAGNAVKTEINPATATNKSPLNGSGRLAANDNPATTSATVDTQHAVRATAGSGINTSSVQPAENAETPDQGDNSEPEPVDPDSTDTVNETVDFDHAAWLEKYSGHTAKDVKDKGVVNYLLDNCELLYAGRDRLLFCLDTYCGAIYREEHRPRIESLVAEVLGKPVKVDVEIGMVNLETPARLAARKRKQDRDDLVQRFEQDSNVQELVKHFSATIAVDSIVPVDNQAQALKDL